jgi:ribonuclease D
MQLITECTRNRPVDVDAVWRIKGSHRLSRPALAVLRELWRWREAEAVTANKPPYFVLSHEGLVALASAAASGEPIELLLPRHLSERRRGGVLKSVRHGLGVQPDLHPKPLRPTSRHPSDGEKRRYLELQHRRDARATELGIDPTLIASRATLSDLAHDWGKYERELMKWQRQLLQG